MFFGHLFVACSGWLRTFLLLFDFWHLIIHVLLVSGYGTRLEKDIKGDASCEFVHLLGVPKPLLPVSGERTVLDFWMREFELAGIQDVFIVTNDHFLPKFSEWSHRRLVAKNLGATILSDGTLSNETRLGACADLSLVLTTFAEVSLSRFFSGRGRALYI